MLITAGPTRAYLDNVRFLSNFSTGSLGYECARLLAERQEIDVYVVAGPTAQPFSKLRLKRLENIETNEEMRQAVLRICKKHRPDFAVLSAAVLDFTPRTFRKGKVSSGEAKWVLELAPTPKIIDEISQRFPQVKKIGFKLEWDKLSPPKMKKFAEKQFAEKKLEALVLNFLPEVGEKRHRAYLFEKNKPPVLKNSKKEIAQWIAKLVRQ